MSPLLQVEDLSIHFTGQGATVKAVDGLTFDVARGRTLGLVYRYGEGSFYPFAPVGAPEDRKRESLLEMQVRTTLEHELPLEPDLANWMPVWGCPVL